MKICTYCNIEKGIDEFVKRSNRKSGIQPYCKECHNLKMRGSYDSDYMKNYDLKKNYNITFSEFKSMSISQNDSCAICLIHVSSIDKKHKKTLCVDHCHKTGVIRGLLCDKCNRAIGLLNEDISSIYRAIEYLNRYNANN